MITHTSTLDPDPKSLKIPDRIALDTKAIASSRCVDTNELASRTPSSRREAKRTHRQILLVSALKDSHGSHTSTAHRHVRQLVRRAVRVNSKEVGARIIDAANDEVSTYVALVSERKF